MRILRVETIAATTPPLGTRESPTNQAKAPAIPATTICRTQIFRSVNNFTIRLNIEGEFTPDYDGYMLLTPSDIPHLLRTAKTVAVVGISDKPERASYGVARYLLENSHFQLFFVNPLLENVMGQKVYKTLKEIPVHIDIVDVFRKPADCLAVLQESIEIGAGAIWLQLGISVPEVESQGSDAGLSVVMDRCIKIDYAAL